MSPYAALSKSPRALADGPMLVLQHPAEAGCTFFAFMVAFKGRAEFMVVKPYKANYVLHAFGSGQDDKLKIGFPCPARMDGRSTPCRIGVGASRW
jgi:hypothetical protein